MLALAAVRRTAGAGGGEGQAMTRVGIVGGTGYTGSELLRLLARHPGAQVAAINSRGEAGTAVADLFPHLRGRVDLRFRDPDPGILAECDLVFFATPNGTAMKMVPELLARGTKVIDLAADFRLKDPSEWECWYGMPHACPDLLAEAVYGLPDTANSDVRKAHPREIEISPDGQYLAATAGAPSSVTVTVTVLAMPSR